MDEEDGLVTVHPRTRGEHRSRMICAMAHFGSSPHTRGTRLAAFIKFGSNRFIPAHAGNTIDVILLAIDGAVHPRTRGEHTFWRRLPD